MLISLITFFPGVIIQIVKYCMKKLDIYSLNSLEQYIFSLGIVVTLNGLYFKEIIGFIISCIIFILIYIQIKIYYPYNLNLGKNKKIYITIIVPILEELIFRYFYIKQIMQYSHVSIWIIIFNILIFIGIHTYREDIIAIKKIVISILLILCYINFENISLCILIHIIYNSFCYIIEEKKGEKYGRRF